MAQLKRTQLESAPIANRDERALLREQIQSKLTYALGKSFRAATDNDWYHATALAVRDRLVDIWLASRRETRRLKRNASTICRSNS